MRISKMSQLFGIPVETLRWYEQQGILKPNRVPDSKYRDYTFEDGFAIYEAMTLRNLGIGVRQTASFLKNRCLRELIDEMTAREKEVAKEVRYQQAVLDHLRNRIKELEMFQMNMEDRWFSYRPAYAYLPYFPEKYEETAESGLFAKWVAHVPLVTLGGHIFLDDSGQKSKRMELALMAPQNLLDVLDLPMDENVQFVPERLCMRTVIHVSHIWKHPEVLRPALDDMNRRGFCLDGPISDFLIVQESHGDETRLWHNIFFPVKKVENPS